MSNDKKKVLRMDQAVMLGAGCLIGGFLLGMLVYHLIGGSPASAPAGQMAQMGQMNQMAPPPMMAPPGASTPDYSSQIREVKALAEKDPKNRNAWVELGNLYFDSNRPQESIEAYTKALALNSNDANVLTDRGIMYRSVQNFNAALEDFRKAAKVDPTHYQCLYNEGITLLHDLNDSAGALKAWEAMLARNPPPEVVDQMKTRIAAVKDLISKGQSLR